MRILVVDDDFAIRKIFGIWLKDIGTCECLQNGQEAVNAIKKAYEDNNPYDLVCMDIMMPVMNGIDALKSVRNYEKENNIPIGHGVKIIMTTAAASPKSIMGAFNEQCEAYLVKPIEEEELLSAIQKLGINMNKLPDKTI